MVTGFCKSDEGVKEYRKLGLAYPNNLDDERYEEWIRTTSVEDLSKYTSHKEKEVSAITVHQIGTDENDKKNMFVTYAFTHYRLDPACNVTSFYRSGIGKYPIPRAHYRIKNMDFGKQEREVDHVQVVETGYSIKYTKANLQKIADIGLQSEGKVSYSVTVPKGIRISVVSFNDLLNGSFNELAHFGKIVTPVQRKRWIEEEGGTEADQQRYEEFARKRTEIEQGIRPINVTEDEVREMIRQEQKAIGNNTNNESATAPPSKSRIKVIRNDITNNAGLGP